MYCVLAYLCGIIVVVIMANCLFYCIVSFPFVQRLVTSVLERCYTNKPTNLLNYGPIIIIFCHKMIIVTIITNCHIRSFIVFIISIIIS